MLPLRHKQILITFCKIKFRLYLKFDFTESYINSFQQVVELSVQNFEMLKIIVTKWLQDVTFWYYKMYNQGFQHKIPLGKTADQVFNVFFGERLLSFRKLSTVLTQRYASEKVSNTFKKTVLSFNVPLSDGKARS